MEEEIGKTRLGLLWRKGHLVKPQAQAAAVREWHSTCTAAVHSLPLPLVAWQEQSRHGPWHEEAEPASAWCLPGWPAGSHIVQGAPGHGSFPGAPGPHQWWGGSCQVLVPVASRVHRCCCSGAGSRHLWWAHSGIDSRRRRKAQLFAGLSFHCSRPRKNGSWSVQCSRVTADAQDPNTKPWGPRPWVCYSGAVAPLTFLFKNRNKNCRKGLGKDDDIVAWTNLWPAKSIATYRTTPSRKPKNWLSDSYTQANERRPTLKQRGEAGTQSRRKAHP